MQGVRKRYPGAGVEALRGIDLEIAEGDFASIVGRSGSGKTTLLNLIGGLDTSFEGEIEVGGGSLRGLPDAELAAFRNRRVGLVFQDSQLLDHLSCADNVALAAHFERGGRRDRAWLRRRADEVLEAVGLGGAGGRRASTLSGGERQRVALARALLTRADCLLLDEPTAHLDAVTERGILERLAAAREGRAALLITHRLVGLERADEILVLERGRVVERGTYAKLRAAGGPFARLRTLQRADDLVEAVGD